MTLIKCPHCGHTVLSVASQCPSCHGTLGSAFLGQEHTGALAQCRHCGQRVRTRSRTCPHCGRANPASRFGVREAAWVGALLLLAAGAVVVLRPRLASLAEPAGERTAAPAVSAAATPSAPAPEPHAAPPPVPSALTAPAVTAPVGTPSPLAGVRLQTRWTSAWVNLRLGPDTTAPVLRALPPGTEVNGVRGARGWWAVQLGGDSVGYIAGSLLSATPLAADTLPPP